MDRLKTDSTELGFAEYYRWPPNPVIMSSALPWPFMVVQQVATCIVSVLYGFFKKDKGMRVNQLNCSCAYSIYYHYGPSGFRFCLNQFDR